MADCPPPPSGAAILGKGLEFTNPTGFFDGWRTEGRGRRWEREGISSYAGSSPQEYYAAPIGSPLVEANQVMVERLNPTLRFPWFSMSIPPPPPVPEGYALLGLGREFAVPPQLSLMRITRGRGDSWFDRDGNYNGDSRENYYAALIDSDIVAANREIVERLNPGMVFPWTAPAAPGPDTPAPEPPAGLDAEGRFVLPPELPPLPPNCALLGPGTQFSAPNDDFTAYRWHPGESRTWMSGSWGGNGRMSWYAATTGSDVVRMNRALVELNNPGMAFPWTLYPEAAPVVPAAPALPYPPPPEGMVVLGIGRSFTVPNHWFEGVYYRTENPGMGWQAGTSFNGTVPSAYYAARPDTEVVRINAAPVPVPEPPVMENPVTPITFRPFDPVVQRANFVEPANWNGEAMLPGMLPDRCILLGWSDQLDIRDGDAHRATYGTMREWIAFRQVQTPRESYLVAARPDSAVALRNPAAVAHWNPGRGVAQAVAADRFRRISVSRYTHVVPHGWVLMGHGDEVVFNNSARVQFCPENGSWRGEEIYGGQNCNSRAIFACRPNDRAVADNRDAIEFHNPGMIWNGGIPVLPPFPPLPWVPSPLPSGYEDYFILGIANLVPYTGSTRVALYCTRSTAWRESSNASSGSSSELQAFHRDSLEVQQNMDRAAYYNPETFARVFPPPEPPRSSEGFPRLFNLSFNGVPVADKPEWLRLVEPLAVMPGNFPEVAEVIWESLFWPVPEERIEEWTEREPVILAGVDFHVVPVQTEVLAIVPAPENRSIGDIITRAAASSLLRGGLSNHFQFLEGGEIVVNPQNPPSLEQGYEIIQRTLEMRETGQKLENYSAWTLGMLGDQMERLYGDAFDVTEVLAQTNKALNTYQIAVGVFKACWATRRQNLSYTHHREVYYSKVTDEEREFILDMSSQLNLTVSDQRKVTSYVRVYGTEGLVEDLPQDTVSLMERLETRSVNKNYMFFMRSDNRWYRYRGPFERIPNGANPIVNADTRALLSADGTPQEMPEWLPPGEPVTGLRGNAAVRERNRRAAVEGDEEVALAPGFNPQRQSPTIGDFGGTDPVMEAVAVTQTDPEQVAEINLEYVDAPVDEIRLDLTPEEISRLRSRTTRITTPIPGLHAPAEAFGTISGPTMSRIVHDIPESLRRAIAEDREL